MKEKKKDTLFDIFLRGNPNALRNVKEHQKVPIMEIAALDNLPKGINFKADKYVCNLISLILERIDKCAYDGIGDDEPVPIVISPYFSFNDEANKFLVHLLCKRIISNLYLPLLFSKEKSIIQTSSRHSFIPTQNEGEELWKYTEDVFREVLYDPEEFKKRCTSFNLLNRKAFILLAKSIIKRERTEKQKEISDLGAEKATPRVNFENGILKWKDKEATFERGQGKMLDIFLKNSRIYYGNNLYRKGDESNIEVLIKEGGYNEKTFRDALKNVRNKLKGFPMKIKNEKTHHYILEIAYPPSNRRNWKNQ